MPRSTQVPAASFSVSSTGLSPAVAELSSSLPLPTPESRMPALQPRMVETTRFGLFPFRSPLLWESRLISFPPGTEMFHFPGSASSTLSFHVEMPKHYSRRVSPFRHPPPVFPAGATRPCLDDCREIFAPMTNHGLYVSKLVVEVGGIEPSTLCVQSRCSPS